MPFFFNDTATTEIYTLSLHDALPILLRVRLDDTRLVLDRLTALPDGLATVVDPDRIGMFGQSAGGVAAADRKGTRLNSSHANTSYALFCLENNTYLSAPLSRSARTPT